MAEDGAAINGVEDQQNVEDFFDADIEAKVNELTQKLKSLELEKADLSRRNDDGKERIDELVAEIERLKGEAAAARDKFESMEKQIELAKEDEKAMESILKRAMELETEVSRLQHDLIAAMSDSDEANKEAAELKAALEEKAQRVEGLEREVEIYKTGKAESEMKVRDLERKVGVLEVKEVEAKGEKLIVERELKEKIGEKEKEIGELKDKVASLEAMVRREAMELEKWKKEKTGTEEALRESQKKAKDMESKLLGLQSELERAEKVITELNEHAMETINGTINGLRGITTNVDGKGSKVQWPLVAVGSTGAVALVAAVAYICYARQARS